MTRGRTGPDSALKHGILLAATFFALVPSIFMILTSLKSQDEYTFNKIGLPHALVLDQFESLISDSPIFDWMGNSAILVIGAVLLSTVVSCLGAYAIALMRFRGRSLLFSVSTALMAVPPVVMIVPLFVLYTQLDLISTFRGTIVIYAGLITPFSIYLLTTFSALCRGSSSNPPGWTARTISSSSGRSCCRSLCRPC